MNKILTVDERISLISLHKKERDKRIADRLKVVLWHDAGWTFDEISKALFLDDATVRLHLERYKEEQSFALRHKGSTPILTDAESQELSAHLEEHLYLKIKDIQAHVRIHYGKECGITTLYEWLEKHNFTYKKPKLAPKNADPVAQQEFVEKYDKIMNEASLNGEIFLFGDSVHPTQQTRLAYGWVKKGKEKIIEVNSGRKRVNIMGTLMLETMNFVYKDYETINGESAVDFLKTIEAAYPCAPKIHLIWDQAGYHTCKEVAQYLENSRIKVHFLPPRSPNLNSIE